jgi:hypothetical protein
MIEIKTIEGVLSKSRYKFRENHCLKKISFKQAMNDNKKSFLSEFENNEVAISVWTTPKRTKTPPWKRVHNTLPFKGEKISIIPVQASYGLYGDRNILQPSTISWMSSLGIYVIVGVFVRADSTEKGATSANTKEGKKSTEGKLVFEKFQYELDEIENQINRIITESPKIQSWNQEQLKQMPILLQRATEINKQLGSELGVKVQNFKILDKKIKSWVQDFVKYLLDHDKKSISAQNRESKSSQKLENVPGNKGKIEIDIPNNPKLHLTADMMEIDQNGKLITLLEGKNSSNKKFPEDTMVYEQIVKLILLKNCNFKFNGNPFKTKLICSLTGNEEATDAEIKKEYPEIIDECKTNEILFQFNGKNVG